MVDDTDWRGKLLLEDGMHMVAAFEIELTNRLDFDVSLVWDRVQEPTPDADVFGPEQDDWRFIIGQGFNF